MVHLAREAWAVESLPAQPQWERPGPEVQILSLRPIAPHFFLIRDAHSPARLKPRRADLWDNDPAAASRLGKKDILLP